MKEITHIALPPLVEGFENGKAKWKSFDEVDFEVVGIFLSCHLVIEHYVDEFICAYSPAPFGWRDAKLTFAQKLGLISGLNNFPEPFTVPAVLKHFNSVRNRLSHRVDYRLTLKDLGPEIEYLQKTTKGNLPENGAGVKQVLECFASMICVYFASAITHCAEQKHNGMNGAWKL
ncbi:UNVERIFIED_ORG: hypothetical protein J2W65_003459 [Pseudomonas parafulva]|nr:hypothetical protein [Pseudomonas parafulva]